MRPIRRLVTVTAALIVPISVPAIAATAQWKPEQTVEIVIGSAAGSGPDRNARVMQKIFQDGRFVAVPVVVMNKPVVANAYISKFDGNGHYLLMSGKDSSRPTSWAGFRFRMPT